MKGGGALMASIMDKTSYKGVEVNFLDFELIILDEYGGLENIPEDSEAYKVWSFWKKKDRKDSQNKVANKKYKPRELTNKEKEPYEIIRKSVKKDYEQPNPLTTVLHRYQLDSDLIGKLIKKKKLTKGHLALALDVTKQSLYPYYLKNATDEVFQKLLIAFPEIKEKELVISKKVAEFQPKYNVKPELFDLMSPADREYIFETYHKHYLAKRDYKLNVIEMNRIHKLYGIKNEDMIVEL